MPSKVKNDYLVLKDTREKEGHGWDFATETGCLGTSQITLKTGDYTLAGLEDVFVIERKGRLTEFVNNIIEKRFENELERLDGFAHPFIVLEFTINDIMTWPYTSLPKHIACRTKIKSAFILKRLNELEIKYKSKFILTGKYGKEYAKSLFLRMAILYAESLRKH